MIRTKHIILLSIFLFSITTQLLMGQTPQWLNDYHDKGLSYKKIRYIYNMTDTSAVKVFLNDNQIFNDFYCQKGWVVFSKNGELESFCLSQPQRINNVRLPANTWVVNATDTTSLTVVFPRDTTIDDFPIKCEGGAKGIQTMFYPSGKIKKFFPNDNFTKQRQYFCKSLTRAIHVTEEGNIFQEK